MKPAALYVQTGGVYQALGLDCWDEARDARLYRGPGPVVAHPPCERWGKYATMGHHKKAAPAFRGDDGGCFAHALWAVRTFGGVLEHPRSSQAWAWFGLPPPGLGWGAADPFEGRSCCVEQGRYGHRARKRTLLYAVLPHFPELDWRAAENTYPVEHMSKRERAATPEPFARLLVSMVSGGAGD